MKLETRLHQMKQYLKEALNDPIRNKLYIEDLELSISFCERQIVRVEPDRIISNKIEIMDGFAVDNQNEPYKLRLFNGD